MKLFWKWDWPMYFVHIKVGTEAWKNVGPFQSRRGAQKYIANQSPAEFGDVQGSVEVLQKP